MSKSISMLTIIFMAMSIGAQADWAIDPVSVTPPNGAKIPQITEVNKQVESLNIYHSYNPSDFLDQTFAGRIQSNAEKTCRDLSRSYTNLVDYSYGVGSSGTMLLGLCIFRYLK